MYAFYTLTGWKHSVCLGLHSSIQCCVKQNISSVLHISQSNNRKEGKVICNCTFKFPSSSFLTCWVTTYHLHTCTVNSINIQLHEKVGIGEISCYVMSLCSQVMKNWHLLIMACTIIAVTVVLLVVENAVPTLRPYSVQVPDRERGQIINVSQLT